MATWRFAKLHSLGNDFLIHLDWPGRAPIAPALARALCHRRTGVGADGVVRATGPRDGGDATMELLNCDGGQAEMSGNALRCLAVALADLGIGPGRTLAIETPAGLRRVEIGPSAREGSVEVACDMGQLAIDPAPIEAPPGWRGCEVRVGNPHLVLLGTASRPPDLRRIGPLLERSRPGGVNVEAVVPDRQAGGLALAVWERGVGITRACGTGSCAAAAAARSLGLVGDRVQVRNPGGTLAVALVGPPRAPRAELRGPVRRVAVVDVDLDGLVAGVPGSP